MALLSRLALRLFCFLLLDFLNLVEQVVGLLEESIALPRRLHDIRLAAIEEVQVGHGIVVIRFKLDGRFQILDSFFDKSVVFLGIAFADVRRKRGGVLHLLLHVVAVIFGTHLRVAAIGEGPIDDADGIVRLGILRLQRDVFLVVALGFLKFLWIKGLTAHLVLNRSETVDGAYVVGVHFQHAVIFLNGLIAVAHVLFRGSARNVLAGIGGGKVKARIQKVRIEILGLFEELDGLVVLAVLEFRDTFVKVIAGLQLAAARETVGES